MMKFVLSLALITAFASSACEKKDEGADETPTATAAQTDTVADNNAGEDDDTAHDRHSAHEHMKHKVLPADDVEEGASVYQLGVELVAEDGEARTWDDFRDERVVTSMIYSSCTTACPLIVQEIKNIIKAAERPDHPVLLISMDPERDTPEALAEMKKRHDLGDNWTLVRPGESDVRELAAAFGIRYRQLPSGDFNHSQVISLLDENGAIAARADGLGPQRSEVVAAIVSTGGEK